MNTTKENTFDKKKCIFMEKRSKGFRTLFSKLNDYNLDESDSDVCTSMTSYLAQTKTEFDPKIINFHRFHGSREERKLRRKSALA